MSTSEEFARKSKKALKRKISRGTQEYIVADCTYEDEVVVNVIGTTEAQSAPDIQTKKEKKAHQDVKEDNLVHNRSAKRKWVKFYQESPNTVPEQNLLEGQHQQRMAVTENGAGEKRAPDASDASWIQKASWKSLVGETGRVAFSLGSVLEQSDSIVPSRDVKPSLASTKQASMDVHSSNNVSAWMDRTSPSPTLKHRDQPNKHANSSNVKQTSSAFKNHKDGDKVRPSIQHVGNHDSTIGLKGSANREVSQQFDCNQVSQVSFQYGVSKGCTFMRSENYEKEWLQAKKAVKEIFKRTRKDALRSIKMFHTRQNA